MISCCPKFPKEKSPWIGPVLIVEIRNNNEGKIFIPLRSPDFGYLVVVEGAQLVTVVEVPSEAAMRLLCLCSSFR
jgi:hypothetical protein